MNPLSLSDGRYKWYSSVIFRRVVVVIAGFGLVFVITLLFAPQLLFGEVAAEKASLVSRVELVKFDVETLPGDSEPFITVHFKNNSESPSRRVSVQLKDGASSFRFPPSKAPISTLNQKASIGPGEVVVFPIAALSEFLATFQSSCPGCFFLGIGLQANMAIDLTVRLCQGALEKGRPCQLEYAYFPLILTKEFSADYWRLLTVDDSAFVYFSRKVKSEYTVPRNE